MSGIDEQYFAPECPNCGDCREWNVGHKMWILTEKAVKRRNLKYAMVCFGVPSLSSLHSQFECITCRTKYTRDTEIRRLLYTTIQNQIGKLYHKSIVNPTDVAIWDERD